MFAYGGCFGPTTIDEVEKRNRRAFVVSGLVSMACLGMRDQNSITFARELTSKEAELVCDPVILCGYTKELQNDIIQNMI